MTISLANSNPVQIAGNGSWVTTSYPWKISAATDLIVGFITPTAGYVQQTSGFTVSGVGKNGGGSITFSTPAPLGTTVDLRPLTPEIQPTDWANSGTYLPENTTNAVDRLTRMVQDLTRLAYTFGIHGPDTELTPWNALPTASLRANAFLGFDSAGLPVALSTSPSIGTGINSLYAGLDTGTANAYTLTPSPVLGAYTDGALLEWVPANTNTGASTVNASGLGPVAITNLDGSALKAGQIVANQFALMICKGGQFRLLLSGTVPLVLPGALTVLGALAVAALSTPGVTVPDAANNPWPIGYKDIPQNLQNANYTTVLADDGKHIYHTDSTARTWTIDSNANVPQPIGATHTFVNDGSGAVTIAITSDTLVFSPGGATGSRTLAQYGRAVALKVAATRWWISGTSLT